MFQGYKIKVDRPKLEAVYRRYTALGDNIQTNYLQCAQYLTYCGQQGIIFNPKKLEVGRTEVNIFGLRMTQQGVLPTQNQVETMIKYPTPKCLRDMIGFLELVNQATFCLGKRQGMQWKN